MLPVRRCLHTIHQVAATADATLVERILDALTELESAYARPSERIVALEAILQTFERRPLADNAHLSRLLRVAVDRRQGVWARRCDSRPDAVSRTNPAASKVKARRPTL